MRPFGRLARPVSRFQRPYRSWRRRLFFAGRLRLGFLLTWLLIVATPLIMGRTAGREFGYFYSTAERVTLWDRLLEGNSAGALVDIYGHDSSRPEAVIARHALDPSRSEPAYTALLQDREWSGKAVQAQDGTFDRALLRLTTNWDFRRFEVLLEASQMGRRLTPRQQARLDVCRREAAKGLLRIQPEDDRQTRELCHQADVILRQPWRLTPHWYQFMTNACQLRQVQLLTELGRAFDPSRQVRILRVLLLLSHVGRQDTEVERDIQPRGRALTQQLLWEIRQPDYNFEMKLRLLAYYRALVPTLEVKQLSDQLTPRQRELLNLFDESAER